MKYMICLCLVLLTACKNEPKNKNPAKTIPVEKATTYYLIRHAEKELADPTNEDPYLTEKGLERAKFWSGFFSDKSIDLIYSTEYARAIQTVIPIMDSTGLKMEFYSPNKLYSDAFLQETYGKKVLIVGHQSSVPTLVNKLLGKEKFKKISAEVYGNLFTVTFKKDGSKTVDLAHMDDVGNQQNNVFPVQ